MMLRVQFMKRTNDTATQTAMVMPDDITQNIGAHNSIIGKMMTRIVYFDYIAIDTTSEPVTDVEY